MKTEHISTWIYQAYLYIVSIIALIICIIGAVTLVNLAIKTVVFGVTTSWYESPITNCQYELQYDTANTNERRSIYSSLEECIAAKEAEQKERARYDIARDVSQGTAMVLIGFPIYFYHWRKIQKLHSV